MSDDDDHEMVGAGDHDDAAKQNKERQVKFSGKRSEALNAMLEDGPDKDESDDSDVNKAGKKRGKNSEAGGHKEKKKLASKKCKRGQAEKPKAFCVKRITKSCCNS